MEIHATLPFGSASGFPPPPPSCQSLAAGGPCGTGHLGSLWRNSRGRRGSCAGGCGIPGVLAGWIRLVTRGLSLRLSWSPASWCPTPLAPCLCLESKVSECFASALSSNSQHGSTMCPDGAISSWKLSVPGGSASLILTSPGPQKCSFSVVKSRTALLSLKAVSPKRPGRSEFATAGVLNVPRIDLSSLFMRTGRVQS